jgi:hypothetical protein
MVTAVFSLALLAPAATAAEEAEAGLDALRAHNYCRILAYLQAIYRRPPGTINRYVIADLPGRPGVYVQCWIAPDRSYIECEAASGQFLRPVEQLVPARNLKMLPVLGFGSDPGHDNYTQEHPLAGERELARYADLYIRSFYLLYDADPATTFQLEAPLVRRPPPLPSDDDRCRPLIS